MGPWCTIRPRSLKISMRKFEDTLQKKRVFFLLLHSSRTPLWIIVSQRRRLHSVSVSQ